MAFTSQTCSVTHDTSSSEFYTQRLRLNKNPDAHDYICHQHRAQSGTETDDDHGIISACSDCSSVSL